jgi:hypothetical protein
MHRLLRAALAAISVAASWQAPQALAEVIDDIAIEQIDSTARVRLRFTGPVHYLRQAVSGDGVVANVYLQALEPEAFGRPSAIDEVRHWPGSAVVPPFSVRVRRDPGCDAAPNPVCIFIRFERAARYRVRLGEDRRSLLLDFASEEGGRSPSAGKER